MIIRAYTEQQDSDPYELSRSNPRMLFLRVRHWALERDVACPLPTCTMLALIESIRVSSMENTRHTSKMTIGLRLKPQCREQIYCKLVRVSKDLQSPILQSRTPTGCRAPRRTHPGLTDSELLIPHLHESDDPKDRDCS